jgi:hypothetical protein
MRICERLSLGESLRHICEHEDFPDKATIMRWLRDDRYTEFRDQYARARENLVEHWAEEIIDIADDGSNDYMERLTKDGKTEEVLNSEHINRSRLRVDTRKWLMSKLTPKKYGDFMRTELSGADGGPVAVRTTSTDEKL